MILSIYPATRCPRGKIRRKGYSYTRNGTRVRVKGECIIDQGKPGKGPKILPKPREGALQGWKKDMAERDRHRILKKVTRQDGCATVIRRLVLLRNISADRPTDRIAKRDETWLHKQPWCKLKTKAK